MSIGAKIALVLTIVTGVLYALIIISMVLFYSISNGIALGFITYGIAMIATNRGKEVSPIIWALDIIFIFYFYSLTII